MAMFDTNKKCSQTTLCQGVTLNYSSRLPGKQQQWNEFIVFYNKFILPIAEQEWTKVWVHNFLKFECSKWKV
jgi:hypothetical protein